MTERLIATLRDEGSLVLTTAEAQSKAEALEAHDFLVLDLATLPQPEWIDQGYSNRRFAVGSVDIKRNWSDEEEVATYAQRQMALALDHIAAAKYVLENPPPAPPQYREERKLLLKWLDSPRTYPDARDYGNARWEILDPVTGWDTYGEVSLHDVVHVPGGPHRHLFGVMVSRKVLVEDVAA